MKAKRIALFPLEAVLFPGMSLPLHIFEPRYKLMTRRCLEKRLEFGVVLAKSEGIAAVGCTAEIVKLVREYPDGRMDLLTAGQDRFRVSALIERQPYLEADVDYLEEDTAQPPAAPAKLLGVYQQCYALVHGRAAAAPEPSAAASLAFHVAAILPFELEVKQQALEMASEADRQTFLIEQLEQWLPQLDRERRARAKAGGNGHGVN
jgi:Lon protease-like protein